jgi:hypothetical protein
MARLQSLRIERFKRVEDAAFDLQILNVLVGGNNAGKSSLIQGLHFAVGLLQTIGLIKDWPTNLEKRFSTSLNPNELIYCPSEDVYALGPGGKLLEAKEKATTFHLTFDNGDACQIEVRKGRNQNILVSVDHPSVALALASLEKPFSIFSPGLAGIAKREPYIADGVLLRALARGDANLVLRNILLRLWNTPEWTTFMEDLNDIFPDLELRIEFNINTDENISVMARPSGVWVPLEIAGTGVLQATQILSYIHKYKPSLVVLDEPDSHLHPNNQRLLCALLRRVAEERGTQVLLTTHSRHVVDAFASSSAFLWVRNGDVETATADDEIGVLMELGALDIKERAGQPGTKAVVLTEDEITKSLENILVSSGFDLAKTAVLPYYGVTNIKQLRPLVKLVQSVNPAAKVIIHRDRDFLEPAEVDSWKSEVRSLKCEPFVTKGRDIEAYFLDEEFLIEANPNLPPNDLQVARQNVFLSAKPQLVADFVNSRIDHLRKNGKPVNNGQIAVAAHAAVNGDPAAYSGKTVLRALRLAVQQDHAQNLVTSKSSALLKDPELAAVAKKAFGNVGAA